MSENYVPTYARNDLEIWMQYKSNVIDRELGYAADLWIGWFVWELMVGKSPADFDQSHR